MRHRRQDADDRTPMSSAATATRRAQVLEAAAELFSESGSAGTSIAAVAARVGISDAGVLYHFPTKEQLLLGVLGRYARGVEEDIEATGVRGIELLRLVRAWGAGMEDTPEVSAERKSTRLNSSHKCA